MAIHRAIDGYFVAKPRVRMDGPVRIHALSILKMDTTIKDNVREKRMIAGWDLTKLEGTLLAFQAA